MTTQTEARTHTYCLTNLTASVVIAARTRNALHRAVQLHIQVHVSILWSHLDGQIGRLEAQTDLWYKTRKDGTSE